MACDLQALKPIKTDPYACFTQEGPFVISANPCWPRLSNMMAEGITALHGKSSCEACLLFREWRLNAAGPCDVCQGLAQHRDGCFKCDVLLCA